MTPDQDSFVERLEHELRAALDDVHVDDQPWEAARADVRRRAKRRRQRLVVPLAAAATAAVVAGVVVVTQPLTRHSTVVVPPARTPMRVVATATFADTTPAKLAVGGGAVFAALWDSATVVKLDATTLTPLASVQVGSRQTGPLSIAYGAGSVWVPNFADGRLWRINPATMHPTAKIKLPAQASTVAYGDGSVWVTLCCTSTSTVTRQRLLRIDPATGRVTGDVTVGGDGETVNVAVSAASVVVSSQNAPLTFIDPRSLAVQRQVPARCGGCDSAPGIASGSSSAYVATGTAVTRLDLSSGSRLATSPDLSTTTSTPFGLASDDLWTITSDDIVGLDPGTLAARERVAIAGASEVVIDQTSLLVSTGGKVLRLARKASPSPTPPPDAQGFRVAAPMIFGISGPAPLHRRTCRPEDVVATGQLVRAGDAVYGVVHFNGSGCSLSLHPEAGQLVDQLGRPLGVLARPDTSTLNPPANPRPDIALGAGAATWGFAWRGSWCGPAAVALDVPIHDPRLLVLYADDTIRVRLDGPSLGCSGHSSSRLVPGVFGGGDEPVLPPPPDWSRLSARLTMPARVGRQSLSGLVLTLHNNSDADVHLSPCPDYAITVGSTVRNGTAGDSSILPLPCGGAGPVIAAHGQRTFSLPPLAYDEGGPDAAAAPGTRVTVSVAIADVKTATAVAIAGPG